jgi:16S rRNA (guanine966-N2)-methyltransferase
VNFVSVVFHDQVEAFGTLGAAIGHEVTGQEGVIVGPLGQAIAGSLALDTDDLVRHVHRSTLLGGSHLGELVASYTWAATAGHTGAVRIVAGSARGRRLVVPDGLTTRPTTDRVREATFNALFSLDAIEDGATHATFVERDRSALAAVRKNIETLGFGEQATVVAADSMRWVATAGHHDVVLADPPYGFDEWDELLLATQAGLFVAESNHRIEVAEPWEMLRERTYGSTVVSIVSGPDFGS